MNSVAERATCKPAVLPYFVDTATFDPQTLPLIYRKLVAQDILADLIHEKGISEEEFVRFVTEETLLYLFLDESSGQYVGMAWVTEVAEMDCFKRGAGSFIFFREFWDRELTKAFGLMFLSHIFNLLDFDLIVGLTPSSNKLARIYCKRLGFDYVATLPNYTCHRGEIADGLVCEMTKSDFNRSANGMRSILARKAGG